MKSYDVGGKTIYELAAARLERHGLHKGGHHDRRGSGACSLVAALAWGARYVSLNEAAANPSSMRQGAMEALTLTAMADLHAALAFGPKTPLDAGVDALGDDALPMVLAALKAVHGFVPNALRSPPVPLP